MVRACKCEKIPEREFDAHPEIHEGWEELCRKGGYVYIGYRPNHQNAADPPGGGVAGGSVESGESVPVLAGS